MKKDIDLLLEIALTPMELPDQELNDQILRRVKERQDMKKDSRGGAGDSVYIDAVFQHGVCSVQVSDTCGGGDRGGRQSAASGVFGRGCDTGQ